MQRRRTTAGGIAALLTLLICSSLAAAETPQSYLKINDDTLGVTAGKPVRFFIQIPGDETWAQANVAQFQVRTFGKTETITPDPQAATHELTYRFEEPGYAMIIFAAGAAHSKGQTDSVSRTPYCSKLLIRVDTAKPDGQPPAAALKSPGLTAKVGMKVEISPYIDPLSFTPQAVRRGADLPVRVYFEGAAQKNAEVKAYGPGGTQQTRRTDTKGLAHFKIDAIGRWVLRYQHDVDGVPYTGDLVFDAGTGREGAKQ
jgi:hypothetical protein